MSIGTFPFGQPIEPVIQTDRTPKKVFVLGVYASAVHARWIGPDGKIRIRAVAVKSEPYIFWRGENAAELIKSIEVPQGAGHLEPAGDQFNGPSGNTLDSQILKPLGLDRSDTWLCDLVPHSCMNPNQEKALKEKYDTRVEEWNLPQYNWPPVPKVLADEKRVNEIVDELKESKAEILISLGDQPIKWFLSHYTKKWLKLDDFGTDNNLYGKFHDVNIKRMDIKVLPLAHPRQIGKLGMHSPKWYQLHEEWIGKIKYFLKFR